MRKSKKLVKRKMNTRFNLILFDDNIHYPEYVISTLEKVCGFTKYHSWKFTMFAEDNGSTIIKIVLSKPLNALRFELKKRRLTVLMRKRDDGKRWS
jgi:ATP-dependent Clp protease adapter protein ClpS